jgi:hypothetical protein
MNSCEDHSNPLGEGPIDTLAVIDHAAELGIVDGADEVLAVKQLAERRGQALAAVRALHERETTLCIECADKWPCLTIRAIDGAGA